MPPPLLICGVDQPTREDMTGIAVICSGKIPRRVRRALHNNRWRKKLIKACLGFYDPAMEYAITAIRRSE